jgi:hypothetical protein
MMMRWYKLLDNREGWIYPRGWDGHLKSHLERAV